MANRIQPHPNPPYLKSDGTINALGQIKTYEAGTTTPKVVYKDAAGTSYGSTIDLDSAGLPEDGPIYWDTDALYKVEVYTRTDDTPTYALDYTVDNFGELANAVVTDSQISTATTWTVDGVGATSTTFLTLADAMTEARQYYFVGSGSLKIVVNNDTYTNEVIDFFHPQGQLISIEGQSEAGVIYHMTSGGGDVFGVFELTNNSTIGSISKLTLKQDQATGVSSGLMMDNKAKLLNFTDVTITTTTSGDMYAGMWIRDSELHMTDVTIVGATKGIMAQPMSTITQDVTGSGVLSISGGPLSGSTTGIEASYMARIALHEMSVTGPALGTGNAVMLTAMSNMYVGEAAITAWNVGLTATFSSVYYAGIWNFTSCTNDYSYNDNEIKNQTTANGMDTSIMYS